MVYDEQYDDIKNTYSLMTEEKNNGLSEDRFYQYYYNLLEHSSHYCKFSNVRLMKSIDEKWVDAVETAIPAIKACILNPRKFIEEEREIVNIAMARNISTESIRHLLQHSNMIDEYREDGTVIPNRILNVYKEESMNTYENRFICTLLAELQLFVNKRYDAIFEATKDELGTFFEIESTVDNYTELVDYKFQIKIKDKQTAVENEIENISVFERIKQIHKAVNMLVATEFINTMRRFPQVRHPIVKTNAIQKNKNYKECYKLWDFIHSYQEVGYQVNVIKQDPNISTEFEQDIYKSFLWNYVMVHNFTQNVDLLNLDRPKLKKNMGLAYIRQVLEEIVDGMEMTDDNLRKLVMNELTTIQRRRKKEREQAERVLRKNKNFKGKLR